MLRTVMITHRELNLIGNATSVNSQCSSYRTPTATVDSKKWSLVVSKLFSL